MAVQIRQLLVSHTKTAAAVAVCAFRRATSQLPAVSLNVGEARRLPHTLSGACIRVPEMEHTEADRPPCTPAPYHSAKGLELPDWNAGFRLSSPTFSRGAPVRTPMRLGPPQRTPQAQKPAFKTPALPTFGRTPHAGGASVPRAPGLADLPNVTQADFWLNRASVQERDGNFQAALETLETGLARRAAPTQALTRAISSLRVKMDESAKAVGGEAVAEAMQTPAQAKVAAKKDGRRTSHVRFCTPAPPAYVPLQTPSQTAGMNSCNAGSTPFFSGSRHGTMADLADEADLPVGSPMTVSRKLLQPVLLDTIRSLRTRSALGLTGSGAAADAGMTPGQVYKAPAPATAVGMPPRVTEVETEDDLAERAGVLDGGTAESAASKQAALPEQDRFLLGSMVSPHTGALNMPAAHLGSFGAGPGADTPCSEWSSGASTASIASHMRTCARAGDIDMRDTPACKAAPCQQPLGAPLDTAGKGTPSVLINPLYGNTPSTGSFDEHCTPATVPRSTKRRETIFMTPSSSHGAAAPLMGTAGVRNLFFPAIDEELEDGEPDAEPPTASFAQLAVSEERSQAEPSAEGAAAGEAATHAAEDTTEASQAEAPAEEDAVMCSTGATCDRAADAATSADARSAHIDSVDIQAMGRAESAELSPVGDDLAIMAADEAPRVAPRTPSSALRRRFADADENDAPTPLRKPLRIPTPARAKPPVGKHEMKGLFAGPDAPDPAQLAAMGSRNALSPRRATALMRQTLGHATLLTPVRRSARKPSQAPASAGRMMAATGFAYAPNEALQARMAHLAAEGKLVLGDAQDAGIRPCLHEVGSGEESPVLLEGPPLSEIDPVKQLAQQLDACALDDPVAVLIKAEDTPPSGFFVEAFPPTSPSRDNGSPKIREAVTPDLKRLTRSALKKAATADIRKEAMRGSRELSPSEKSIREGLRHSARVSTPKR